jgi:hypothetical protein
MKPKQIINSLINQEIRSIELIQDHNSIIRIKFRGSVVLKIEDVGQSCCEHRYITTDDKLDVQEEEKLVNILLKEHISGDSDYGAHEIQFLEIQTDKDTYVFCTHNEHNGYYGGFNICLSIENKE